jgi:hypothetical protein
MINAKEELVNVLDGITKKHSVSVKCAWVTKQRYEFKGQGEHPKDAYLPVGFDQYELESFLKNLDFKYDNGFGSQELYGEVWFDDGSWIERDEYDGSECWEYKRTPEIPANLLPSDNSGYEEFQQSLVNNFKPFIRDN